MANNCILIMFVILRFEENVWNIQMKTSFILIPLVHIQVNIRKLTNIGCVVWSLVYLLDWKDCLIKDLSASYSIHTCEGKIKKKFSADINRRKKPTNRNKSNNNGRKNSRFFLKENLLYLTKKDFNLHLQINIITVEYKKRYVLIGNDNNQMLI